MKQFYRQIVLIVLVLVASMGIHAQTKINGITYSFNDEKKSATVAGVDDFYSDEVVIPETVNHNGNVYRVGEVGTGAFSYTYGIKTVVIPNSVTRIVGGAFDGCHGLEKISIPESVRKIEGRTFEGCENLADVTLPSSLESIDYEAFYCCVSLKDIELPKSLNYIGSQAFYGCTKLLSIVIPENVTKIGSAIFQDCYSLKDVELPESLVEIESHAFYACTGLDKIVIPSSVRTIGECAFGNCIFEVMENYSPAPQIISAISKYENAVIQELHVPMGFKEIYQSATFWERYNIVDDLESPYVALVSDGINLALDTNAKVAMVLGNGGKYSGDVV
ncbi:MAG: leucine-rich repeat domain-containing protein, partial [Prevotellaceae bacterium]|nr:leucine-rich repeat domain-containing protein [Prevotellaceae bacterium]